MNHQLDIPTIIDCFYEYMSVSVGKPPNKKEFLLNMEEKEVNPDFIGDIEALLRPEIKYD